MFKESRRTTIAAAYIFLAILAHPEVTVHERSYTSAEVQFEMLSRIHESGDSWFAKKDMAYDLASSLKSNADFRHKVVSPYMYWAFPPSVILLFWGVFFYFYIPKTNKYEAEQS